ncbi:hypothetical protein GDO81_030155 [Engystomops pustulosus]|uniref:Uncharacterized protein n=1 Tax=Engystomops pustulosus TaxID=76066 RepID=A0AAV6YXJ9_ENGPU|nr:hypothetical protein GDO81_030155 [Engystomops pustulosus]
MEEEEEMEKRKEVDFNIWVEDLMEEVMEKIREKKQEEDGGDLEVEEKEEVVAKEVEGKELEVEEKEDVVEEEVERKDLEVEEDEEEDHQKVEEDVEEEVEHLEEQEEEIEDVEEILVDENITEAPRRPSGLDVIEAWASEESLQPRRRWWRPKCLSRGSNHRSRNSGGDRRPSRFLRFLFCCCAPNVTE